MNVNNSYRVGHHSTSDDSTAYRSKESIDEHEQENPITRLQRFMEKNEWWDSDIENTWVKAIQKEASFEI